ncbi:hypothetical protein D3C77_392150 [compost metagenome]
MAWTTKDGMQPIPNAARTGDYTQTLYCVPLYTNVDAVEVERLRQEVDRLKGGGQLLVQDRNDLRAQLAERDTVLKRCQDSLFNLLCFGVPEDRTEADQLIDELRAIYASAQPNQCDGCQAGIPVVDGAHRMGRPGGYPDTMICQAGKYASAEPCAPICTHPEGCTQCSWCGWAAPVERDELEIIKDAYRNQAHRPDPDWPDNVPYFRDFERGWQAHAALERKS